jgi:hypothetical protein
VESPQPLPHKRDTLGIFQFPSGETSDSAVYYSAFKPTLHATSVLNSVPLDDGVGKPGLDHMDYPSSFFDDYDEQDDSEDLDSDDDFDESTLWEISSLLHSKDFPSNENSILLGIDPRDAPETRDFDARYGTDSERQCYFTGVSAEIHEAIPDPLVQVPIQPLSLISKDRPKLWTRTLVPNTYVHAKGLPQPDSKIWELYISKSKSELRLRPQPLGILPSLTTFSMWRQARVVEPTQTVSALWTHSKALEERPFDGPESIVKPTTLLWAPHAIKCEQYPPGHTLQNTQSTNLLWTPNMKVEVKPATSRLDTLPTPVAIVHKARTNPAALDEFTSGQLWNGRQVLEEEHHWISESSIRPETPSVQSESSSGGSSPTSETLSVKSSSTIASSIVESLKLIEVSLPWNKKHSKKAKSTTILDSEGPSASVVQHATRPLPSVRESKVLAFRDLFESRASGSEDTSTTLTQPRSNRASIVNPKSTELDYDVSTRHPVFFTQSLVSSTADIHPAGLGHFESPKQTKEWSYQPDTHNSMTSIASAFETHLWTSLPAKGISTNNVELLWSKDTELPIANKFEHVSRELIRRPAVLESLNVSVLESSELWKQTAVLHSTVNWLSASNRIEYRLWSPASRHEHNNQIGLRTVAEYSSRDLFAHIKEDHIRKVANPRSLPPHTITSSQLFESGTSAPDSPIHWLHATSNLSRGVSRSLTWTAPTSTEISEDESISLWVPRPAVTARSQALFSNPHTAPWVKKNGDSTPTKDISSSELWRLSTVLPTSPKNWLIDRRVSRVQFRY